MKNFVSTLMSVGILFLTQETHALKVLMIGNSFSESVLAETPRVAQDLSCSLDLVNLMIGGCPLRRHWAHIEKAETDPEFRPYAVQVSWTSCPKKETAFWSVTKKGHANIPQMLAAEKWDLVTIQQASHESPFIKCYEPFAGNIIATIKRLAPQAEIRIQETWSYCPYNGRFTVWHLTPDTMYEKLHKAYAKLASDYQLKIIPTGPAVQAYRTRLPVRYEKILTREELDALQKPDIPNFYGDVCGAGYWSQNWTEKQKDPNAPIKLNLDTIHLNPDGKFLQACVWVESLFGKDVTKGTYKPKGMTEEKAQLIRSCAHEACTQK